MRRLSPLLLTFALACDSASDTTGSTQAPGLDAAPTDAATVNAGATDAIADDAAAEPDAGARDAQVDARWRSDATADAATADAATDAGLPIEPACAITGATPLRRLTPIQYRNTTQSLGLPVTDVQLNAGAGPVISQLGAERFAAAAAALADAADVSVAGILPCDPLAGEAICADAFIAHFADGAFRRAPTLAEIDWLTDLWQAAPGGFEDRARLIIEVVLQSPQLLYRFESHVGGQIDAAARAERLAFALTDAPPDARLRAAALGDPGVRAAEARRLSTSQAGREKLRRFILSWAGIARIGPKAEPFLHSAALSESAAFVDRIINEDGTFADLLTQRHAHLDVDSAALYGQVPGDADLPEDERAGLLTRVAFLAAHAGPVEKSPIQRGVFVRAQLLCAPLPPPPPTVDNTPIQRGGRADDGRARSIRQFTATRTSGRDCMGCHDLINPAGFAFGHYDAHGRYIRTESGVDRFGEAYVVPVDAAVEIQGADFGPNVADAVALSAALAGSAQAHDCLVAHWLRAVLDRELTAQDECDLTDLRNTFTQSGGRLSTLMTATAHLAAMRLKRIEAE